MSKLPGMLLSALAMLTATACAKSTTATAPRAISDYCLIAKAITFSKIRPGQTEDASNKYDTPETAKQVEDHDLAFEKVCHPS